MTTKSFVFIIDDLYGGGAEKVLLTVASGLASRGNDVQVWLLRNKIEHKIPDNLDVTVLDIITPFTKAFDNTLIQKWQALRVQRELDKQQIDVLICCSSDKVGAHLSHANQYFWLHGDYSACKSKHLAKTKRRYNGKHLLCVSEGAAKSIESIGVTPASNKVLWNPIDYNSINREADLEEITLEGDYFVCVAALEDRKGHHQLLSAFAQSGVNEKLVLIGKGPLEAKLKTYVKNLGIEKQVIFAGYKTNPYPYIKNAKALLLSSKREGAPLVLVEALMLKTPLLAMDCPSGPREILVYAGLVDYLVPCGDVEGFKNGLQRLSANQPQIKKECYKRFMPENTLSEFECL
ncbi:glycosyltransferase [Agarivorans sp. 1_MG-2023]|uniref:glycosyltransferase n=1 Tax=Agarivorans sp. 1_MG-2023 TaxID=3062634 RepID=UPI0026E48803|nr:glycosyltransferase [Agarivorans sp. 1_MG-2023]MDO6764339.1 glycosyltransferase [Agarivorans sp. 1_MG-2023]